jgi:thiosulfate/3-mercaptopyruvate sulfurtransferase
MNTHIALITPTELQAHHPGDTSYTIIDARPYRDYIAGHIPGAVWMGWETWSAATPVHAGPTLSQPGYWGVLREGTPEELRQALRRSGLSNERPALVYADGPASKGREARIAWMLLYLGLSSVVLLDGGWRAWLKYGGSSDTSVPAPSKGQFHIQIQEHRRIRLEQLRQDLRSDAPPLLIDTRSRAEFAGQCHDYQPRMGRLPGALHLPYTSFFDEEGAFVTRSIYLQRLPPAVSSATHCVAYCEVGVRSCLFALLHELYTGKVVANFDGSFMQWALDETLPVECDAG